MTMPSRDQIAAQQGSLVWLIVIAVWTIMLAVAGTLAIALAIWNLVEAF